MNLLALHEFQHFQYSVRWTIGFRGRVYGCEVRLKSINTEVNGMMAAAENLH